MTCPCQHAMPVPGALPKATGRLSIDRAALRRELGGDAGIREAMTAKATGRPSANVSVLWGYFTKAVYKSGDLPWLATREALQNSILWGAPHKMLYAEFGVMQSCWLGPSHDRHVGSPLLA